MDKKLQEVGGEIRKVEDCKWLYLMKMENCLER
jgi:hypothetical protein